MDPSSEWQYERGRFKKTEKGPLGQTIKRTYDPGLGIVRNSERFGNDSEKRYTTPGGKPVLESLVGMEEVRFLDERGSSLTEADVDPRGNLEVDCFKHDLSLDDARPGVWGTGLHLVYGKDGKLNQCSLRIESLPREKEEEELKSWEEQIQELVNLARSASESEIAAIQGWTDSHRNTLDDKLPKSILDQAETKSTNLANLLFPYISPDDISVLERIGLFREIALNALHHPNKSFDEHVDHAVDDLLRNLPEDKEYSRLLELEQIGTQEFDWKEIDYEGIPGYGEREVLKQGTSHYGSKISAERYRFIVERDGDKLVVICESQKGNNIWEGTFPLTVPFSKIVGILRDHNEDFRKIKDMLGIGLSFS